MFQYDDRPVLPTLNLGTRMVLNQPISAENHSRCAMWRLILAANEAISFQMLEPACYAIRETMVSYRLVFAGTTLALTWR